MLTASLDAFNSGDRSRIDAFLKSFAPGLGESALSSPQFRGQSGGLELLAVTRSERDAITFRVREKTQPIVLLGKMELSAGKSPTIANFILRAVPTGAVLEDPRLDSVTRKQVIDDISVDLDQFYVYPELARKMVESLHAREASGGYNSITDGEQLAAVLSADLLAISHDKHVSVFYNPYRVAANAAPNPDEVMETRRAMARDCGFRKLEILPNNIGYLKLDFFAEPMACGRTAAAALSFLANVDAVIFDLRDNVGGDPKMVAMISTYLFDQPIHLNDFYDRSENKTTEYWTMRYVPGTRLGRKPAYVLTSSRTFSGAEEFAYDLRNLKRITVVGETTAGGSHPVSPHRAGDHFTIYVPNAHSISPITKTDWEGVGVVPDVPVSAGNALETAQRLAAERIQQNPMREFTSFRTD